MKIFTSLLLSVSCLFFVSCNSTRSNFEKGIIPTTPVNFTKINSEYDDYNSKERYDVTWHLYELTFSSNRKSKGDNFDFIEFRCALSFSTNTGTIEWSSYENINPWLDSINTTANELGPYSLENSWTNSTLKQFFDLKRFFYANDSAGNLDIKMIDRYVKKRTVAAINSKYDDAYPCLYLDSVTKTETIYFCSNRDKTFDIYRATSDRNTEINDMPELSVQKVEQLSSSYDDKCPFIYKNTMVFVSNRPGGMGGFDLWYATFNGTSWSEPKNFGSKINTPYDEYRPIVIKPQGSYDSFEFVNDLMIFSSNRPGGKGGFDLYYVGINKNLK